MLIKLKYRYTKNVLVTVQIQNETSVILAICSNCSADLI